MKLLHMFVVACFVIAAAQAVASALAVLLLVVLAYGLFTHPRETIAGIGLCITAGLIEKHPLAFLALVALVALVGIYREARKP